MVRAIDGAQDLQDTTGLGFCMTGWRGRQGEKIRERTVPEEEEGQQGEEGAEGTCGVRWMELTIILRLDKSVVGCEMGMDSKEKGFAY